MRSLTHLSAPILRPRPSQPLRRLPILQLRPHHPFSSTPTRRSHHPVHLTATLLQTLHTTTGLSWVLTLPLFALLLRLTLILPLTLFSRRALRRRLLLAPLLSAWPHQTRRAALAEPA